MTKWKPIKTAYEAYWFLHEHPEYVCNEYDRITKQQAKEKSSSWSIIKDSHGQYWRKWRLTRNSITTNLGIIYQKSEDGQILCCLEFGGPMKNTGKEGPMFLMNTHDIGLDVSAPTFDQALIKMARIVLKRDGDFRKPSWV